MCEKTKNPLDNNFNKNLELTACVIADKVDKLITTPDAESIRSKAFDHIAPNGEKLQVQIKVVRAEKLKLNSMIDIMQYEKA